MSASNQRLSPHKIVRLVEESLKLADRLNVDVHQRAAETLQFLMPLAGEVSTEDQIDDLYDELSVLAKQGNEAEYKNRLVALNSLQAEQAARSAAVFDQWRPLAGDELDRHLADARKLLGR